MSARIVFAALAMIVSLSANADDAPQRETLVYKLPPPGMSVVGQEHFIRTKASDTFADIAVRYAVGYRELGIANPTVDPWLPGNDKLVELPQRFILPNAPRRGIVINSAEMRLYYYPPNHPDEVMTFPVSVGRGKWQTPIAKTSVVVRIPNPAWYPPKSLQAEYKKDGRPLPSVVPPGPDNPLGQYALRLGIPGYLIHGTNHPFAIGMQVTHGCIRLHPHDINLLFHDVATHTPVTIVYQPFKAGWLNGVLYLEVHPQLDAEEAQLNAEENKLNAEKSKEKAQLDGERTKLNAEKSISPDLAEMAAAIKRATAGVSNYWINWNYARQLAKEPDGLPHAIGRTRSSRSETITQRDATSAGAS